MFEQKWETLAAEAQYRPQALASRCNVSLRTLQRHFSSRYQRTLTEWMRELRANEAYQRIKAGDSIKVVSYDLGFKQPSHFSRVFKQVHGVPPSLIAMGASSRLHALLETQLARIQPFATPVKTPPPRNRRTAGISLASRPGS